MANSKITELTALSTVASSDVFAVADVDASATKKVTLANLAGSIAVGDLSDVTITSIASGEILKWNGSAWINNTLAEAGIGDTTGPGSSTDNAIARFDGTGGKTLQNSGITIDDSDNVSGLGTLTSASGTLTIDETASLSNYLQNVVEDTTPQLGGDLDGQSTYDLNNIVNIDVEGYTDFAEISAPTDPAANTVRLWAQDEGGFSVIHHKDSNGIDVEVARDTVHVVRNTTGSTLSKGDVVYINGSNGTFPTVALADASTASTSTVLGFVMADISNNSFGQILQQGDLGGLDTTGFSDGDTIYLSTTAGEFTATAPTGTDTIVEIGTVVKGASAGAGIIAVNLATKQAPDLTQTFSNKTIDSASNTLTLDLGEGTLTGTTAQFNTALSDGTFATSGGAFHDGFSDFVADEHVAHSGVTLTAGDGLSGGGTIAASRTFDVDITNATDKAAPVTGDELLLADSAAAGAIKKSDIAAIVNLADHDQLTNFASNEHFTQANITTVGTVTTGNVDAVVSAASTTTAGKIEVATAAETTTGTDATRAVSPDGLAGSDYGKRFLSFGVVESDTAVAVADGTVGQPITAELNGWNIVDVQANVYTKGVTGTTDVQVRRQRGATDTDVLSTKVTIGDEYYAADGTINTSNDDLATGDMIFVDVDAIHTTPPNGLSVVVVVQKP